MKKHILSIALSLFSLLIYSQTYNVFVSGVISDELTGDPIPQQEIIITFESLVGGGFLYNNTVFSDGNGYYQDIIQLPNSEEGIITVSIFSCGVLISHDDFFSSNATQFIFDFYRCSNPNGNDCEAFFSYYNEDLPFSIQFFDLSIGFPTTWQWDFGDGTTSVDQDPFHIYSQEGEYLTVLTIIGDSCNSEFELLVKVENDSSICDAYFTFTQGVAPLSIEFADASIGNVDNWTWDFGDGNISYEQNPIHTFDSEGVYSVSLFIETDDFCSSNYMEYIFVEVDTNFCNATFNIALDTLNNIPNTYIFTDYSEGEIDSWYWDFGDGAFSFEQNPVHVYSDGGTYYPCLTISSLQGDTTCSSTDCNDITTIDYFNFGGQVFIGNYPINIDSGDNANVAIAYLFRKINHTWYYMDQREFWEYGYYWFVDKPIGEYLVVAELTENSLDYNNYAPSYYPDATSWENASTFLLTNNQQFATNISLHQLANFTTGIGSISGSIIKGISCDTNYSINTNNVLIQLFNSSNELISYTYSNLDGNYEFTGLGIDNYFIKPEYTGKYTEKTNVILSNNEPSLSDIDLVVNCSNPLGVEEITSEYITLVKDIYPNPVTTDANLKITITESSIIKIDILNQFGQILYSNIETLSTGEHNISFPTSSYASGLYFIRITPKDNISFTQKFIKTQ